MGQMRIAVIDDERPARSELKHQLTQLLPEAVIEEGDSGAKALELAGEETYNLFFLDINLGDIQGTVLVNALKKMQPDMKIVFVTAYSEYAVKAFELGVEDYIMKPFDKRRLEKMLKKCGILQEKSVPDTNGDPVSGGRIRKLAINTAGRIIFEDVDHIVFIETYKRGCLIHTDKEEYFEGKPIGDFEKKLGDMGFYRCQKSYLINLGKVKEMFLWKNNSFAIKMDGYEEHILPVGREKIKTLRRLLGMGHSLP